MLSHGFGGKRTTSGLAQPGPQSATRPAIRHVALALLALGALAGLFALVGAAADGVSAAGPGPTRYFTLPQARAIPSSPASSQDNAFGGPWPAPRVAPNALRINNWTNLFPILYAVNTISPTEAWAVGEYGHMVHYTGGAWADADIAAMLGLSLTDVKFLSSTDGYVAAGTHVFHYDGATWTDMSAGLGTSLRVSRVFPLSDSNIWGTGTRCSGQCLDSVVHWDGSTWTAVGPTFTTSTFFYDIAMPSASDGWVVAADINTDTPYMLHYDGTSWTSFSPPPGATTLAKVSAPAVGDPWVISGVNNSVHHIYHYSGGNWTTWQVPGNVEAYGISMLSDTQGYIATGNSVASWDGSNWTTEFTGRWLYDVSAVSGRVWAAGRAETILQRDSGPTWTMQRGGPTRNFLFAVSTLPSGDAWGVGQFGTVIRYTAGAWTPVTTTLTANLWAVQMRSPTDIYIAGDHVVAHCDGTSCSQVATPGAILDGLAMTGDNQGWAVGTDGSIWQDNAGTWTSVTSPTTLPLYFVTMDSPTHGWAGGGNSSPTFQPVLLEYDGTHWVDRTATLPDGAPVLYSLALDAGGATGWAAGFRDFNNGQSNAFMRYSNNTWTVDHSSPAGSIFNVALDSNDQAVGIAGEIVGGGIGVVAYHYYSGGWHQESIPTEWCCQAGLALIPGVGGWSVGPLGNIMSYTSPAGPPNTPTPTGSTTPTVGPSSTPVPPTATLTPNATSTTTPPPPTDTPVAPSATATPPPPTSTPCSISFSDVHPTDYFYQPVLYLACHGVISGYADGTFRPFANTTRAQMVKIVVLGFQKPITTPSGGNYTFADVPPAFPFFAVIETAAADNIVSGYGCGGPGEPCDPNNRPYFRPYANVTRGQLSKIDVVAAGWALQNPAAGSFEDVAPGSAFYQFVETAYCHNIISGYTCGGPGEPCDPNNRPYFRQNANATRGQIAKIVYLSITGGATCGGPAAAR